MYGGRMCQDGDSVERQKDVEFYSNSLNAWYSTVQEKDKSIMTISAGGIGLIALLLTNYGANTWAEKILYLLALLAFSTSIICMITIFGNNAKFLRAQAKEDVQSESAEEDGLKNLDSLGQKTFICAIFLSFMLIFYIIFWAEVNRNITTKQACNQTFQGCDVTFIYGCNEKEQLNTNCLKYKELVMTKKDNKPQPIQESFIGNKDFKKEKNPDKKVAQVTKPKDKGKNK